MITMNNMAYSTVIRKKLNVIRGILTFICFLCYFYYVIAKRDLLIDIINNSNLRIFYLAITLWMVGLLLPPLMSFVVMRGRDNNISYVKLLEIYLKRLPAKYLPGGIWQTVARGYDISQLNVSKEKIACLIFYENFWSIVVAGIVGGFGWFYCTISPLRGLGIGISIFSTIILVYFVFWSPERVKLNISKYMIMTLVSILTWTVLSGVFYLYMVSLGLVHGYGNYIGIASSYVMSWLVGFINIFTPQGIGTFEIIMTKTIGIEVGVEKIIIAVSGFRLVMLIGDLIAYVMYFIKIVVKGR